ncbi:MAG TPA: GNAT family N-acetyltransferase [Pirellulales bacterium]|jgi:GNAT superfamily N-acetyltransferase|nr:GNAT family N-acetyltransferase [Pirellulales bacterium]
MIRGLAEYERLAHEVTATEPLLAEAFFGASRSAEVVIGYLIDEPVGFAVFFHTFSTFAGRRGLYLEDLLVHAGQRGQGFGRQLLAHVAALAVERGCGRLEWNALHWNEPAIRFYRGLGAQSLDEWRGFRLSGDALASLGREARG